MASGWVALLAAAAVAASARAQSNYASRHNSIEFPNEGLPDSTVLDGRVTKLDDLAPVIFLNRTKASLNCAAGFMQIELKFDEPFNGIAYADFDRASACKISGKGTTTARIDLPLKGCGTKQDPQRVFTNNIVVRFHPGLEMEGDEVITIVCRYPPPIAPPPAGLPNYIKVEPAAVAPLAPPLRGIQILMIICGILFLSLVLLGLGCSYYMLRRRRIQLVRRHPLSLAAGSEITKLSGSSLGDVSLFHGMKIPRAHAQPGSTSGSEAALISDTLPSDYPSESPSSAHSEDARSLRRSVSSGGSFENRAFVQDTVYSEEFLRRTETQEVRHLAKRPPPDPRFDVMVRVKKAAPPPPSPTPPPSDSEASVRATERHLTSILEGEDTHKTTFTYVPEIHPPPPAMPPVYSTVVRKQQDTKNIVTTEERYMSQDTVDMDYRRPAATIDYAEARSMTEVVQHTAKRMSPPPPVVPHSYHTQETSTTVELIEPPLIASRRPEIKSHVVDDVFLKTITEKKTIEDIERHRRQVTEYRKPPTKWDVTIRNYPRPPGTPDGSSTDWDSQSEMSSVSGIGYRARGQMEMEADRLYRSTLEVVPPPERPKHWDVMVRVLEPPPPPSEYDDDASDVTSVRSLTLDDRRKWREIITTENSLRSMLSEATVREDYERISRDHRYQSLFEPHKWDVIIRVLAPPPAQKTNKYRRKADWETRSRRSSLPTLYEYESDGESSVRTLTNQRSRRTSRSSMVDLRSMSEMTVEYAREYRDWEEERSLGRSASQPSLARSASEITEHWARPWEPPHARGWFDTDPSYK